MCIIIPRYHVGNRRRLIDPIGHSLHPFDPIHTRFYHTLQIGVISAQASLCLPCHRISEHSRRLTTDQYAILHVGHSGGSGGSLPSRCCPRSRSSSIEAQVLCSPSRRREVCSSGGNRSSPCVSFTSKEVDQRVWPNH